MEFIVNNLLLEIRKKKVNILVIIYQFLTSYDL